MELNRLKRKYGDSVAAALETLAELVKRREQLMNSDEHCQGLEAQLVGVSKKADGFNHMVLDNMMIFDAAAITTPAGQKSVEWLKTLKPDFAKMDVPVFQHGK